MSQIPSRCRPLAAAARVGLSIAALGSFPSQLMAQSSSEERLQIEEVLVTATRREASAQSITESIVAITEEDIVNAGTMNFAGLTDSLAGVELRNSRPGAGSIAIRGVAELNSFNLYGGVGSAVGFYLDEAPMTMAGQFNDMNSFDMARIEVLKGPQGTLYGEGSLAGTVRMISNAPDATKLSGSVQGTYSDTNEGSDNNALSGVINLPIIKDKLALRVVGSRVDDSGFIDLRDFATGEPVVEDVNTLEATNLRASLRWDVTDDLEITLTHNTSELDIGGRNIATDELYNAVSVAEPITDETDISNFLVRYQTPLGEFMSSTSWVDREAVARADQGGLVETTNLILGLFGVPPAEGVFIDQTIEVEAFSQEFRLVSNNESSLNYTVGAFYKDHDSRFAFEADGVPSIPPEAWVLIGTAIFGESVGDNSLFIDTRANAETWAVYGEITWDITDALTLIAGGRYFEEDRSSVTDYGGVFLPLSGGPFPGTQMTEGSDDLFNPRVSLSYDLNDDAMVYATYSEGFRSGGQNDLAVLIPGSSPFYGSEGLTNYELGVKSEWLDRRLRVNASYYYMDWEDLQAIVAEGPGGIGEVVGNVGTAHTTGLDLEVRALLTERLDLVFSGAWLEAETDEDTLAPDPAGGAPIVVPEGSRIPGTSEESYSIALQYAQPLRDSLELFARASYSFTGDAVDQIVRQSAIASYEVVNLRLGLIGDRWRVTLFADNAFDEDIRLNREPTPDSLTGNVRWFWGRPRTVGATLSYEF